jgi:hypothetical protein
VAQAVSAAAVPGRPAAAEVGLQQCSNVEASAGVQSSCALSPRPRLPSVSRCRVDPGAGSVGHGSRPTSAAGHDYVARSRLCHRPRGVSASTTSGVDDTKRPPTTTGSACSPAPPLRELLWRRGRRPQAAAASATGGAADARRGGQSWPASTSPLWYASTTNCARSRVPSFTIARLTCVLAVAGLIVNSSAI